MAFGITAVWGQLYRLGSLQLRHRLGVEQARCSISVWASSTPPVQNQGESERTVAEQATFPEQVD